MTTGELETELRAALIGNAELMAVLTNGAKSIFHYTALTTEPKNYPVIVFSPTSDEPALSGDDSEIASRVTIEIFVITKARNSKQQEQNFKTACRLVKGTMAGLNFVRKRTTSKIESGKLIVGFEFAKNIIC